MGGARWFWGQCFSTWSDQLACRWGCSRLACRHHRQPWQPPCPLGFSTMTAWVVSMMPAMPQAFMRPLRVTCSTGTVLGQWLTQRKEWWGAAKLHPGRPPVAVLEHQVRSLLLRILHSALLSSSQLEEQHAKLIPQDMASLTWGCKGGRLMSGVEECSAVG